MNIGLVVEGPSDAATYPELIGKIRRDIGRPQVRPCAGNSRLRGSFVGILKEFDRNHAWQIEAALVLSDSDCHPSQRIESQLRAILSASRFRPDFKVEFFAPKCDLETWLLADPNAINLVSRRRDKNRLVAPPNIQFETDKAKPIFFEQLSEAGLFPTPSVYGEIARSADIAQIAAACPSFRRFFDMVRAY